ncbi:MAG TPA: alpha/beta fold hydrolase, partial [Thermogutta sp.]|nr:alpha/beta fold hydrolase [Thermogutta sp.]
PHYGVFSPVRGEYVQLVAETPLPSTDLAFDIGTGTGVLAAVLARRGVKRIVATDQDPRALACARENIARLDLDAQVDVVQADLTTPLATFLSNPALGSSLATVGLLRPEKLLTLQPGLNKPLTGLYMVQPYEPDKIPVIMIHGWWSSPMTWIQMFNDLRSDPLIRRRYQFWFYLYPTGQPFWISAAQFRRDLRELRQTLDPDHRQPALDQIVLIGHSMGGLIAELQTIDSGQDFWKLVSEHPFEEIRTDPISREELREIFFFQPNPSIRRIITIATPHLGSHFSNQMTQRLAARLISVPKELLQSQTQFFRENQDLLLPNNILQITDSVDALDPDCPIFALMNQARRASWIVHHNIVGASLEDRLWGRITGTSDGVISWESAHSDKADSEIAVPAEHTSVQSHPLTILEVKRILLEHLAELHQEHSLFTSGALPADVAVPSPVRLPPVEYP